MAGLDIVLIRYASNIACLVGLYQHVLFGITFLHSGAFVLLVGMPFFIPIFFCMCRWSHILSLRFFACAGGCGAPNA